MQYFLTGEPVLEKQVGPSEWQGFCLGSGGPIDPIQ